MKKVLLIILSVISIVQAQVQYQPEEMKVLNRFAIPRRDTIGPPLGSDIRVRPQDGAMYGWDYINGYWKKFLRDGDITSGGIYTGTSPISVSGGNVISMTAAGASTSGYITSGSQTIGGDKTMNGRLTLSGHNPNESNARIESLEFQSFAINNSFMAQNGRYVSASTNFVRRNAGYLNLFYFLDGATKIYHADSGAAGSNATIGPSQLKFDLKHNGELQLPFYGDGSTTRPAAFDATGKLVIGSGGGSQWTTVNPNSIRYTGTNDHSYAIVSSPSTTKAAVFEAQSFDGVDLRLQANSDLGFIGTVSTHPLSLVSGNVTRLEFPLAAGPLFSDFVGVGDRYAGFDATGHLKVMPDPSGGSGGGEWSGRTVVFMGNSITNGVGASPSTNRWTTLLTTAKGGTEVNLGVNGMTLQQGQNQTTWLYASNIPTKTSAHLYLFIAIGINDVQANNGTMTPAAFKTRYLQVLDSAVSVKGWNYGNIVLVTPFYVNATGYALASTVFTGISTPTGARHIQYVDAVKEVAAARYTKLFDGFAVTSAEFNKDGMLADGLHPNNAGYRFIADMALDYFTNGSSSTTTATAAGSNTEIQINTSGSFGASTNFKFDPTTNLFTVKESASGLKFQGVPSLSGYYGMYGNGATPSSTNYSMALNNAGTELYLNGSSSLVISSNAGIIMNGGVNHYVMPTTRPGTNGHVMSFNTNGTFAGWVAASGGGGGSVGTLDQVTDLGATTANNITVGNVTTPKIISSGSAPSAVDGPNLDATVTVSGTDIAGRITVVVNSATSTPTLEEYATVTFNVAYGSTPRIVFSPGNAAAANLGGMYLKNPTTTNFSIAKAASGTSTVTTYIWDYMVVQ